jgi:hypothetical protein
MANIRKKIINKWDTGITTSPRDSNPETSSGAQMIKGFDVYKDSKKLIPMQSWTDFTTTAEKAYNIRAMGGVADTVYGVGYGLSNWYGKDWDYRIRVDITDALHKSSNLPLHLDMSILPQDFWDNTNADMSDVRVTMKDGVTSKGVFIENLNGQTGDMWIEPTVIDVGTPSFNPIKTFSGTGSTADAANTTNYAQAVPVILTGETINHLTISAYKMGTPTNMVVKLYSDNAGTPNALVATLGTISAGAFLTTNYRDVSMAFDTPISYSGVYWIVFTQVTPDASNYYRMEYGNTGVQHLKYASNSGLTAWSSQDTAGTANLILSYFQNTGNTDKYFYIYYGNSDATAIPYGDSVNSYTYGGRNAFTGASSRFIFTFGDNTAGNRYYDDGLTGETEAFTTDPELYTTGYFGNAIRTGNTTIETDQNDEVDFSANNISVSFMVKVTAWENVVLLTDAGGYWDISLNTSGKILFTVNGSDATTQSTSTLPLTLNEWHVIDCVFNQDQFVYIDGELETFDYNDGDYDGVLTNGTVILNTGNRCTLAQVYGFNASLASVDVQTKLNNFLRDDFISVGSQEAFTSISPAYSGVQLYSKSVTSGDWIEYIQSGSPVKSMSYFPLNGFIDANKSNTYFPVTSTNNDVHAFLYLAAVSNTAVIDPTFLSLGFGTSSSKIAIQKETAIDGTTYFNDTDTVLNSLSSISAFTNLAAIQSISAWKTYLGIGANSRSEGFLQIWDLASSEATDKVKVGTGNLRIVGNASDILFCVVDNFIDDAVRSSNKPTMEIKQYVGDGKVDTTHVIEIPAVIDDSTYLDEWELAVSNFKLSRNFVTLFYARLPSNSAGTTFNEGLWAVGKNSDGQLSLSLMIDTSDLGMPENIFGFAQQVFFIKKDGGIVRLSDNTYTDVSLFTTLKMNEGNTEIEKKLHGVEIVTEPLESGQTISLYYKRDGDASRTKIGDFTGTDEVSKEFLYDDNGNNFFNYKEIEFDVESTGGKSSILEVNYKFEYLSDIV